MTMTLETASMIISGALAKARTMAVAPLAVAVLDAGGHLVAFQREDGASLFRAQIAIGKATGALGMGMNTRELAVRVEKAPMFFTGVMALTGGILPSPGGMLVRNETGTIIGAVGISGDQGDVDEACALAGIAAAGLGVEGAKQ